MKKKVYAVWFPGREKEATFFDTWQETEGQVSGVSGIRYRGFPDRKHAEEFLGIIPEDHGLSDLGLSHSKNKNRKDESGELFADLPAENTILIYVDGSFREGYNYAGWGWVALGVSQENATGKKETLLGEDNGVTPEPAVSRNIDGEITGVLEAVKWVENYLRRQDSDWMKTRVVVLYDYVGIEAWAIGKWKSKTPLTKSYQEKMIPYRNKITFKKVPAHSGKRWNEYVDRLAKNAITE